MGRIWEYYRKNMEEYENHMGITWEEYKNTYGNNMRIIWE